MFTAFGISDFQHATKPLKVLITSRQQHLTEKPKKSDQPKVPESDTHWSKGTLDLSHMLKRHTIC